MVTSNIHDLEGIGKNNQDEYDFYKLRNETLEDGRAKLKEKLRELSEYREKEILDIINSYTIHYDGILIQTLAKLLNLHRKSITPYIKSLTDQGKIKRSETSGKLVSTFDVFKDPMVNAEVFGYYFKTRLLNKSNRNTIILNDNTEYYFNNSNDETEGFTFHNELFQPKFSKNDILEEMLFEFSIKIGSFITYLIIYAMNQDNYNNNLSPSLSDKDKDEIVKEVIKKGILSITPILPRCFKEMYDKRTGKYPYFKDIETKRQYLRQSPKYLFQNKESILSLLDAFTKLYPLMSYEFEKIMPKENRYLFKDVLMKEPSGIEGYKEYMKEFYESLRKQENCKHEYEKRSKSSHYQCKLCNHVKK